MAAASRISSALALRATAAKLRPLSCRPVRWAPIIRSRSIACARVIVDISTSRVPSAKSYWASVLLTGSPIGVTRRRRPCGTLGSSEELVSVPMTSWTSRITSRLSGPRGEEARQPVGGGRDRGTEVTDPGGRVGRCPAMSTGRYVQALAIAVGGIPANQDRGSQDGGRAWATASLAHRAKLAGVTSSSGITLDRRGSGCSFPAGWYCGCTSRLRSTASAPRNSVTTEWSPVRSHRRCGSGWIMGRSPPTPTGPALSGTGRNASADARRPSDHEDEPPSRRVEQFLRLTLGGDGGLAPQYRP